MDRESESADERCEMCARAIEAEHAHVVDVKARRLLCTCRACHFFLAQRGARGDRLRAVPDRYRFAAGFVLDEESWTDLQIPVRTAFFLPRSTSGRFAAFYPGPAGATESLLNLSAWDAVAQANPVVAEIEPDVEALLVHGLRGGRFDCFLVPINACYELVGRVRRTWRGFDGGAEAWSEIDAFFAALRGRAEVAAP